MPILQQGPLAVSYVDEGTGPVAVLIHSGGMSSRQWGRLVTRLRGAHRVIAPDLLGYGASSAWPPDAPFHFDDDVRLLEALLDSLPGPFDLVGHSYGGLLALRIACRRPDSVRSLSLYEPVAFGVLYDPPDAEALANATSINHDGTFFDDATGGEEAWLERFIAYWNGPGAWGALPEPTREAFRRAGRKLFQEVRSLLDDRTPAAAYRTIAAKTLIFSGALSPVAARHACARLTDAMPRASHFVVAGAGHMGPITHAATVNDAIANHIESDAG